MLIAVLDCKTSNTWWDVGLKPVLNTSFWTLQTNDKKLSSFSTSENIFLSSGHKIIIKKLVCRNKKRLYFLLKNSNINITEFTKAYFILQYYDSMWHLHLIITKTEQFCNFHCVIKYNLSHPSALFVGPHFGLQGVSRGKQEEKVSCRCKRN